MCRFAGIGLRTRGLLARPAPFSASERKMAFGPAAGPASSRIPGFAAAGDVRGLRG
jgi:hypothetical protein